MANENGYKVGCFRRDIVDVVYVRDGEGKEYGFSSCLEENYSLLSTVQWRSLNVLMGQGKFVDVPVKESRLVKQLIGISKRFKPGQSSPELTEAVKKVLDGQG